MVISDMRMESDVAGREVIQAARTAPYHPAVALLTAFPDEEIGWDGAGPDKIFVKPTQTRTLLRQIEKLFASHAAKLSKPRRPSLRLARAITEGGRASIRDLRINAADTRTSAQSTRKSHAKSCATTLRRRKPLHPEAVTSWI